MAKRRKSGEGLIRQRKGGRIDRTDIYGEGLSDPTSCRKRLSKILEHAGCKHVRFHDLRHTFATHAIQYGMDVKTLAATIGHASVETTLNTTPT